MSAKACTSPDRTWKQPDNEAHFRGTCACEAEDKLQIVPENSAVVGVQFREQQTV